jgi:hypothetical protein
MQRRIIMAVLGTAIVITLFLGFQAWSVVAQSRYSQSLIVQTRLTEIQFVVDSTAIRRGYLTANLTFRNPTTETITLATVETDYYEGVPQNWYGTYALIADGAINTTQTLSPGDSLFSVRVTLNPYYAGNASLAPNTSWIIKYYPQFGLAACEMIATVRGSSIQTTGPFMGSGYSEPYTTLNMYVFSIINTWAIALEIVAVSLIMRPRAQKAETVPRRETHNVMLSIIYGLQGVGFLAAPYYFSFIYALIPLAPLDPYQIAYGGHGAAGMMGQFLLYALFIAGLVDLLVAVGLFLRWNWTKNVATAFSAVGILGWLYIAVLLLQPSATMEGLTVYTLTLAILFVVTAAANGIVVYVLWRGSPLPSQGQSKAPSTLASD